MSYNVDHLLRVGDAKTIVDALKTEINKKADANGVAENLTAGTAEQILSDNGATDKTPYVFRRSGGGVAVGNREKVNAIVGGTVVWNQFIDPAQVTDLAVDGTRAKTTALTPGAKVIAGHKYLYVVYLLNATNIEHNGNYGLTARVNGSTVGVVTISTKKAGANSVIFTSEYSAVSDGNASATEGNIWEYFALANSDAGATVDVKAQLFDLTQMFGSAIADYIASLETATAGAGVAWFKNLFPADYYAYNAGELMSVNAAAHKTVGFNAWDGIAEDGTISSVTGEDDTSNVVWRSANYIPVLPGTQYYAYTPTGATNVEIRVRFYDASKNYIGYTPKAGSAKTDGVFTTPDNCYFMRICPTFANIPNRDVCINIYDASRNGTFEPYAGNVYPLDASLTLRGVPGLDSDNKLTYNGDTYEPNGTVTRKYAIDQMTYEWVNGRDENNIGYDDVRGAVWVRNWNYDKIPPMRYGGINAIGCPFTVRVMDSGIISTQYRTYIYGFESVEAFKSALLALENAGSGFFVCYQLGTPTTETASPYTETQIVDADGTEEYVDASVAAGTRDVAVPVGHDTLYPIDMVEKLSDSPDNPDSNGEYVVKHTASGNAYEPLTDADMCIVETVSGATPSVTGAKNTRYVCGEVTSISITPVSVGVTDVVFTSGATPAVLTVPNTVKFPAWFDKTALSTNAVYEINILDGVYAAVTMWAAT